MMTATSILNFLFFATLLAYGCNTKSILSERLDCPEYCSCYFIEMNWMTDCLNKSLTSTSYKKLDQAINVLNMSRNHLSEIKSFPADVKIQILNLSENFLTKIQKTTFGGLQHLIDVDLSYNLINYVDPEAFVDNAELITLRLNQNPLNHVNGSFLCSKSLQNLYLVNCNLTTLSTRFFSKISGLNRIDLSENPINIIEPSVFNSLASLKHLILSKCNLSDAPADTFMTVQPTWVKYESGGNCNRSVIVERPTRILVIREVEQQKRNSTEKYLSEEPVYVNKTSLHFITPLVPMTAHGFITMLWTVASN